MKHIKTFEDSFYDEFPGMFSEKEEIEYVPGFESGTIDPEDTNGYEIDGIKYEPESELYKKFLNIVKERNFKETSNEIIINLKGVSQDYCMSIYNWSKHLKIFLKEQLIGKYISKGFENILTDEKIEGIITDIVQIYINGHDCMAFYSLIIKDKKFNEDNSCKDIIVIDKIKSNSNKYNL